ncbi:PilZ domain-containing protein [Aestuariibacter salexigens]|uniref:PilZ domain-containing protein n=1 Tax=Aestuariibacter salexigens TaxID=226010 RepID=UPI0003F4C25A|nr:PilZ domain-containing protein [Aestuariibacter salexigens]
MTPDLEQYRDIIEQLKPMINEPEFNQVLAQVASGVPKEKRFLIKMELKRLARPCIRRIDLRNQVDGECREFVHDGRSHFLDDIAIDVYERQVRLFSGYTIGVYEAVMETENNIKIMQRKQAELDRKQPSSDDNTAANRKKQTSHLAERISLLDYPCRAEERMNFAVSIEVFSDVNKSSQAVTLDMSVSGLKIKLSKDELFKPGERLSIQFRGLEGEYTLDKKRGVNYTIVHIDRSQKEQRLSLQRLYDVPNESFENFIDKFIHGNKRRYKVNMDNTLEAVLNKTCEQYYTPSFTSVPVFIESREGKWAPHFVMANDFNREILSYWADEKGECRLGYILSQKRLEWLIDMPAHAQEMIIYVFNHVKDDKVYFYSASIQELNSNPKLKDVFLGFGARKASWRILKVQLSDARPQQAYTPLSIPSSISESVKRQNQPPPPRLMAKLKNIKHLAVVTDITDEVGRLPYHNLKIRREQLAELKIFGHPRNRPPAKLSIFRYKYMEQRSETRYQLRSKVLIEFDGMQLEGVSEDVSVHGLRIELESFFHGQPGNRVKLSFPQLQKVTKKYSLNNLSYQVRNVSRDRNILHLQADSDTQKSTALAFFDELIRNNRSRLKAYRDEEEIPGIGSALRSMHAKNQQNIAFFIRKDGTQFVPDRFAARQQPSRLYGLFAHDAEQGQLNFSVLTMDGDVERPFLSESMRQLDATHYALMHEILVAFDPSQRHYADAVVSRFSAQFTDDSARKAFIQQALENGQFVAVKLFIVRTGRPDLETIQSELNYISVYAMHKAKELEEQLWSITGIGNMVDVTDEVMMRFGFDAIQIKNNQLPPEKLKVDNHDIEELLRT